MNEKFSKVLKLLFGKIRFLFAEKYVIDGKPGLTPFQFFAEKVARIKDFLRNHRNIKVRMILICKMEQQIIEKTKKKNNF